MIVATCTTYRVTGGFTDQVEAMGSFLAKMLLELL